MEKTQPDNRLKSPMMKHIIKTSPDDQESYEQLPTRDDELDIIPGNGRRTIQTHFMSP